MLIVPLEEAREGMKLAAPVLHPDNPNQQLLRSGYVVDRAIIARMGELGIDFLYVDYPELEALDKHLAVYLSPARQAIYKDIKQSITAAQKQTRAAISYENYCTTTRDLISTLLTQGQNPIYLDQMSRQGGDTVAHAAAVAHLSLLLGLKLEQYLIDQRSRLSPQRARDVVNLGVAAMLHDLGLSKLPEALQRFSDVEPPEDEAQQREWQTHSRIGYDLIHNDVEATAAAAVYQHHQHFDGSGFPELKSNDGLRGTMAGERIHVFARIIMCANLYDRLSSPREGKGRRSNSQILKLMGTTYAGWCDPAIMKVLQTICPPYPPGCRVQLASGERAVVVEVNPNKPLLPIVRLLGPDNWTMVGEPIDLSQSGAPKLIETTEALQLAA